MMVPRRHTEEATQIALTISIAMNCLGELKYRFQNKEYKIKILLEGNLFLVVSR